MDSSTYELLERRLRCSRWFSRQPSALRDEILRRSVVRRYAKGEVVSIEDGPPKGLYCVLEGHVRLLRHSQSGDESLLRIGGPGYWFGELGLLTGSQTVVTIVAGSGVRALFLPRAEFERIVADEPRYYAAFAGLALDRFARLLRMFVESRVLSPENQLRIRLADIADSQNYGSNARDASRLRMSQADLASLLGISRQTLNELLGKLKAERLVEIGFRSIRVPDPARLRASVDYENARMRRRPSPGRGAPARRKDLASGALRARH
jgi:CRP-like cAMP-binding protein